MTDNPFDALGGGGLDMNALMQQAQQMQEQLVAAQERLAEAEVEGTVSGGTVTVTLTGDGQLRKVDIKAGEFDGTDADDLADLGDMIVAAFRDAKTKADEMAAETLGPLAGGLGGGLPGQGEGLPGQGGGQGGGELPGQGGTGDQPPSQLGF